MINVKTEVFSRFDIGKKYSNTHYAVTLVTTLAGHAQIIIEGLDEQDHLFCNYAHLARPFRLDLDNFGTVRKFSTHPLNEDKFKYTQSITWIREKEKVQNMIDNVENGPDTQEFSLFGRFLHPGKKYNCFTWAIEKLQLAGIYPDDEYKSGTLKIKKNLPQVNHPNHPAK